MVFYVLMKEDRVYPENIIIQPLLTEKSNGLKEQQKYTFKVAPSANKIQIKHALHVLYNVTVLSCYTVNVKGKKKRQGKYIGKTSAWKKAIVTLKKGDAISVYEGI